MWRNFYDLIYSCFLFIASIFTSPFILINHTISCFDSWMRKHDKNFTLQTIVAENNFRFNAIAAAATILCLYMADCLFLPYPISTSYHIDKFFFFFHSKFSFWLPSCIVILFMLIMLCAIAIVFLLWNKKFFSLLLLLMLSCL